MTDYRFTPEAEDDLFEIWRYIARDSVAAANRVESAVHDACFFLAQEPQSGPPRKHVTGIPVYFWTVQQHPNYVVVYRRKLSRWRLFASCTGCAISSGCSSPENPRLLNRCHSDRVLKAQRPDTLRRRRPGIFVAA
jgi:antitoxin ParD1/3/4